MGGQKQRFSTLANQVRPTGRMRVPSCSVEVSGRSSARSLEDHLASARAIATRCCSLRKVPALASKLIAKIDIVEQRRRALRISDREAGRAAASAS